jgi:hypothetical protein
MSEEVRLPELSSSEQLDEKPSVFAWESRTVESVLWLA